uniref:Uncharacterized protein n=1 Tax=Rhizophagus irregularis (strain DAOM 181602 / DAOM 197198 / MUCL 43194) TaxID=747089 RepID=U9UDU2_RHIID
MYNFVISFRTTSGGDVFINDPSVFLRRAPPPDCESTTTKYDRNNSGPVHYASFHT